jgi:glycerol-1-phosphate dehydrogenase [NAD(P)+]
LNAGLAEAWNTFVTHCESIAVSSHRLEAVLSAAGAPTGPESIGVDNDFYTAAVQHARELRNRYTFLDLAADAGELDRRISIQR